MQNSCKARSAVTTMGYRHYFYLVEKSYINKVKDLSYEEIQSYYTEIDGKGPDASEDEQYISLWDIIPSMNSRDPLFEFGKLYWCDTAQRIMDKGVPLFSNKDVQDRFSDEIPFLCGKEAMLEAIESYRTKLIGIWTEWEEKNDEELIKLIRNDLRSKKIDFNQNELITDPKEPRLTKSWFYEYTIFNLIHQVKTLDWDKYALIFVGY
jgi:hypothetical protein